MTGVVAPPLTTSSDLSLSTFYVFATNCELRGKLFTPQGARFAVDGSNFGEARRQTFVHLETSTEIGISLPKQRCYIKTEDTKWGV